MGLRRLAAIGLCLGLALAPAAAQDQRTIRIATEGAYPPFNYLDNNEPQGFEIDLGRAFCAAMNANCVFVVREWEGIVKGLLAKDYDAAMASLLVTERRKERIAFSKPYYRIPVSFIARQSFDAAGVTPAALAGKRIGTTDRSEHLAFLEARYPESEVKIYAKFEDAHLDLVSERIDLVLGDRLALNRFIKVKAGAVCCRLVGDAPHDLAFYSPGVAIGLRKDDKALKESFDRAIEAVKADGTYDRIRAKYLPFDVK